MVDNKYGIDLDETAELPTVNHETTDIPHFPSEHKELKDHDIPFTQEEIVEEPEPEEKPKKSSKNSKKTSKKKGTFKKNPKGLNIAMTVITIIVNVLVTFMMFSITRYAAISTDIFLKINIGVLIVLLLIDLLLVVMIKTRKVAVFVIDLIVLCLFLGVGGYGTYIVSSVNNSVDKITTTNTEKDVSASLVVYSGTDGDPITTIKDLNGRNVGVSTGSTTGTIAEKKFKSEGINANIVDCSGYDDVLQKLIDGTIDCAVLSPTWQSQFQSDASLADYLSSMTVIDTITDKVQSTGVAGADKDITKEPFTVLVTGENEGLADTIILMSVNPVSMKVIMTSIPRDSYVPISCYNGSSSKINAAHATSEACMVQTVEDLTGVDIDYTIEMNFASVIQVVDAVGGIDINVEASFDAQCWDIPSDSLVVLPLEEGYQHLNGTQALGYARERYAFEDGDFARQRHQQEIIELVLSKLLDSKSPQMFLDVLSAAGDNIQTNFTVDQMTSFVNYALKKAQRYYDSSNPVGVFNFVSSREYGYDSSVWNAGLAMNLYTYNLFDGSVADNTAAIERNNNLYAQYNVPENVNWSANSTYTPDPISAEWYTETLKGSDTEPTQDYYYDEPAVTPTPEPTQPVETTPSEDVPADSGNDNPVVTPEEPAQDPVPEVPSDSGDTSSKTDSE